MNSKEFNNKIVSLSPRIYPLIMRMLKNEEDALDAVQEVMLKLWNKRKSLKAHPNPEGFVFVTARNYCLDKLKKRNIFQDDNPGYLHMADTKSSEIEQENMEASVLIKSLISRLPDTQKEVITLRDLDGLEFEEIAEVTGIKIENIRVLLSRARKVISTGLSEIYNYEYGTLKKSS